MNHAWLSGNRGAVLPRSGRAKWDDWGTTKDGPRHRLFAQAVEFLRPRPTLRRSAELMPILHHGSPGPHRTPLGAVR